MASAKAFSPAVWLLPLATIAALLPLLLIAGGCGHDPGHANETAAVVQANPGSGQAPLAVEFDASGSQAADGGTLTYAWEFGDETGAPAGVDSLVVHTYESPGTYAATLTVTDGKGATASATIAIAVTAPPAPPVASLVATPSSGLAPLTVQFDASASHAPDGGPITFRWELGDSPYSPVPTSSRTSYEYKRPGTYQITLTVKDDEGNAVSVTESVTVLPAVPIAREPEVVSGVEAFQLSADGAGVVSLAYCDEGCRNIYYRSLDAGRSWTSPELLKEGWDRETGYFAPAEFSLAVGPDGVPHVFWGENKDLFHAQRGSDGAWTSVNETEGLSQLLGRANAVHIGADGTISVVTSADTYYGPWPFSVLGLLRGKSGERLAFESVPSHGEEIFDVDIAYTAGDLPVFAVGQGYYGGWNGFKLVYPTETGEWEENALRSAWALGVTPVRVVVGTSVHAFSSNAYARLDDPSTAATAEPVWVLDQWPDKNTMAVDDEDEPYVASVRHTQARLIGRTAKGWDAFMVNDSDPGCPDFSKCVEFRDVRLLYSQEELILAYLGNDRVLRFRTFRRDDVRAYFDRAPRGT